ncbi:MAG: glycosyltransferase family 39 protein [Myxococcota bacterium]
MLDRGDLLLLLAALPWIAFCGLLYASYPPSPDQWFLDYTGWMITRGAVPYRDFLDGVWPMGHWLHALSTLLFGTGLSAWRCFDFLFLVVCTAFGADLARRLWGRAAGAWMLVLYPALYIVNSAWFEGERDLVAANAGWIVLWAYFRGLSEGKPAWQILTGLAIAFSALIKPTFLGLGPALALHAGLGVICGSWRLRDALAQIGLAGGSAAAGLALGFAGLALGGSPVDSFLELGVRSVGLRFGNDVLPVGDAVVRLGRAYAIAWHWIGAGALASLAWRLRRGALVENLLLPAALLAGCASYFAQGQALYYTLGPVWATTIAILCSGLGLATERWRVTSGWRRSVLSLLLLVAIGGTAKKLWTIHGDTVRWWTGEIGTQAYRSASTVGDEITTAEALALAGELRAQLPEGETVLVWGRANAINVLAERPQPTRFHHYVHLTRSYLPQDLAERWGRWFEEDLERSRPRFCLVNHRFLEGLPEPRPAAALFLADYLDRNYLVVRRIGESTLHERRPAPVGRGGSE